jgi:hypothetical protein
MIKTILMALSLAGQSAPAPLTVTPAQFAQALQGVVGQRYEGGVTIARIFAEDRTLVIVLDGPPGWRTAMNAAQVSALFTGSFCEDAEFNYFVDGNTMRVDTTVAGAEFRPGPIIRGCATSEGTQ